jgi:polar amino acid transport system ATP-binding protein
MMIEIQNLKKSFGERVILDDVSLTVQQGTVCGVLGPSGSGKSTLLRCVNFLETFESGQITIDGEAVGYNYESGQRETLPSRTIARMRSQCCMVFQQFNLFSHMTALDNVAVALVKVRRMPRPAALEISDRLLGKVGLSHRKDAYPAFLSGGEQQRVAIARALAMEPKVLLLDEVTSALDPEKAAEVLDVIAELSREGMTMMMVTHQIHFAREICDQVIFMDGGGIVERGAPEILSQPATDRLKAFLRHLRLV